MRQSMSLNVYWNMEVSVSCAQKIIFKSAQSAIVDTGTETLRTRKSEFGHPNLTPLELAHEMEVYHLYDILRPVIKRPLPPDTLQRIEYNFHRLIRSEIGRCVDTAKLYLPALEVLTELDGEAVWFPIKFGYPDAVRH